MLRHARDVPYYNFRAASSQHRTAILILRHTVRKCY